MNIHTKNTLKEIGILLNKNQFPRVYNDGIVKPSNIDVVTSTLGEVKSNVTKRQRRPKTRPWQRPTGRQRQTHRPGASGTTTPFVNSSLRAKYEAEIKSVQKAYPTTKVWKQDDGMWLITESSVLLGLSCKATFIVYIPYRHRSIVKGWGFWTTPISFEWIGPRHTNFPDGSICAFEPKDNTWVLGGSIINLLDIYTIWALRQLHLKTFTYWPGYQSVNHPYERVLELKDNEFCGCDSSHKHYIDCCKQRDLARNQINDAFNFWIFSGGSIRNPPKQILDFIREKKVPPRF